MRRTLLWLALLAAAGVVAAIGGSEIKCAFLGSGGSAQSAQYSVRSALGSTVVGTSSSAGHELIHGPIPCQCETVTAIDDEPTGPRALRLHQNFPNPFNPSTSIRYELPRDAMHVRLVIYDSSGRRVRTLVDEVQSAGQRSVVWNGRDDSGRSAASGVYFARLDTAEQRLTRKLTLLK